MFSQVCEDRVIISIHALREEGDLDGNTCAAQIFRFLSTPSARRATTSRDVQARYLIISIHALREEGDILDNYGFAVATDFYPRPPRGGRPAAFALQRAAAYFYPRPPRGGRRTRRPRSNPRCGISIHALREEGDLTFSTTFDTATNFYPRPPRGGRRHWGLL